MKKEITYEGLVEELEEALDCKLDLEQCIALRAIYEAYFIDEDHDENLNDRLRIEP